jgi:signal transduction histidine kinase
MVEDNKRKPLQRDTTDDSLRAERRKTDAELASHLKDIKQDADHVVAEARHKADSVLSDARDREDRKLADEGTSGALTQGLEDARAREDAALMAQRGGADAAVDDERARRLVALASLLAFERQDTDLRLQIERASADEALTSREDFLAMVSHDLRTLLGGIALSAEMLQRLAKSDEPIARVAKYADGIQRCSARMNRLVGDLMDVASIEAGKLSIAPERNDPNQLVRDSLEAFQPAAHAQGIELTCEPGTDVGVVELDHERILQVLTNLVGNALKFTAKSGRISIRVEPRGQDVCFVVADTGEGIPADRLDKVFERYFQSRKHDRRGLGLGLYIAKSIVEAHRGKIWAESALGQGSTFFFTLPAVTHH